MRVVNTKTIAEHVERLLVEANYSLPESLQKEIINCERTEENELARSVLSKLTDNLKAARDFDVPICQDTGMAVVFIEIGQEVFLEGDILKDAVNDAVASAYTKGYMRKSIVSEPLFDRINTKDNTPCILYTQIVSGNKIKITVSPKGFGSENMSRIKMFNPTCSKQELIDFVVDTVSIAGGKACPPLVVGVGIGGTFDYCAYLSKKALVRDIDIRNEDARYSELEKEILQRINQLNIGPQGFGGKTTAFAVNIEYYPTHIAGLPCAVNIGCHVTRHKTVEI